MNALNESILSLKRNLGLTEENALELLNTKISVRATGNVELRVFEDFLLLMLNKTFLNVELLPANGYNSFLEITINVPTPAFVFIRFPRGEACISLARPEEESCFAPPDAFQLLTAAYATGAAVVQSTEGRKISRGESYPIHLNWEVLFGNDLSFITQETDIGEHHLAGLGATGSWLVKTMEHMNIKGKILGYDDDFVSAGNLQRTTFDETDISTLKVSAISKSFNPISKDLSFIPIPQRYSASHELHENVITCVDSRIVRRSIQDSIPRRTFDCSTTDISEISLFFGGLSNEEACLACLYAELSSEEGVLEDISSALGVPKSEVKKGTIDGLTAILIHQKYPEINPREIIGVPYETLVKALCGKGTLKPDDESKLENVNIAPLCHVSAVAGIMLAIEIKRRFHFGLGKKEWNYWKINPWAVPSRKLKKHIGVESNCTFHQSLVSSALKIWDRATPVENVISLSFEDRVTPQRSDAGSS